ncbi:hypothetical protein O181_062208 [Austropuccinia psidii MF-1]|uniref:Uncharacterized protein n=1 Tax=Austropuccinia psidii MF-1 TaxID=1389203 RepID=A0A9Q3EPB3_9BASI|nr:hypothetical protein [Austropuccinia psidii MF-1]
MCLSTPNKKGFKYFSKKAVPIWKPPDRTTITTRMEQKAKRLGGIVREALVNVPTVCLTADCWTEKHTTTSFLGVTMHYPVEDDMESIVLGLEPLYDHHTADFLASKVDEHPNT